MKFVKSHGGREKYFSVKYKKNRTNDCVVRSIAHATNRDYLEVFKDLCELAVETGHYPSHPETHEKYLESIGWIKRKPMRKSNGRLYKINEIKCDRDLIISTRSHLTYLNGNDFDMTLYDTWNCGGRVAYSYWENIGDYSYLDLKEVNQ